MTGRALLIAIGLAIAFSARASENHATTNRLQQQTPDAETTTGLGTQTNQPTTTGLSAHSQRQPTLNNLQSPPQPSPDRRTNKAAPDRDIR